MKNIILTTILLFVSSMAQAEVQGKEVTYRANGTLLKGYIAYDDAIQGKRPGVLVVHEWCGLGDYARKRAQMLAQLGYTALALDMYGEGRQAHHPDDAGKFAGELAKNLPLAKIRFEAAMEYLRQQKNVDAKNIAALGYCFGGSVVLQMARLGEDLKGVASFHGNLATEHPAQPGEVRARIISFTGTDDPMIPAEQVAAFKQEMEKAGADYKVVTFAGAKHSFTNPAADEYGRKFNLPLAYDAAADKASWNETTNFLAGIFKQE
ncbi:dienelactone hydrolase family protein [Nitrosospira sp. Nsp1]|uniref:dienelactone hydrolase family protein n=1 Tax=Nitrosospira sp. Nsp1 TaxID=136547 RepID=UPI00087FEEED|nr:dienelactone hydrolase family protein [Nitrosospira sp. Nsp1]SCX54367.1 Dienelactone hydrolase [Nitrosospira sp. Nsp1]